MIEDFKIKEKISDFFGYSYTIIEKFPNRHRILKDHIFNIFFNLYDTAIQLQYQKDNQIRWQHIYQLDIHLNRLKHFIRFSNDRKYFPHPAVPPLSNKSYEVMANLMTEIGQMINGYMNSLTPINMNLKHDKRKNNRGPVRTIPNTKEINTETTHIIRNNQYTNEQNSNQNNQYNTTTYNNLNNNQQQYNVQDNNQQYYYANYQQNNNQQYQYNLPESSYVIDNQKYMAPQVTGIASLPLEN